MHVKILLTVVPLAMQTAALFVSTRPLLHLAEMGGNACVQKDLYTQSKMVANVSKQGEGNLCDVYNLCSQTNQHVHLQSIYRHTCMHTALCLVFSRKHMQGLYDMHAN